MPSLAPRRGRARLPALPGGRLRPALRLQSSQGYSQAGLITRSTIADAIDEQAGRPIHPAALTALHISFDPSRDSRIDDVRPVTAADGGE